MTENNIAAKAGSAIVEGEIAEPFVVIRKPRNFFEWVLYKIKPEKAQVTYRIRQLLVGNRIRVASKGINFSTEVFNNGVAHAIMHGTMAMTEETIYIAAVGIQNDREEPSPFLLDELRWVDEKTLAMLVDRALSQVDIENFMQPIILISGTNVLKKMSPPTNEEIIAS